MHHRRRREFVARQAPRSLGAALTAAALFALGVVDAGCAAAPDADPWRGPREALVNDLVARGLRDRATILAMRQVPRHEFVPPEVAPYAYEDRALPIGQRQTISQPWIVAVMTEAIRPRSGLRVLEIGTGSGYQAAVLAAAGCEVRTIELLPELADSARARLARLGYASVEVRQGDGWKGWPEAAPFEAIVVTAAPDRVPEALLEQLAPGGRLVVPIGPEGGVQQLRLYAKDARGRVDWTVITEVLFVPMRGGSEERRAAPGGERL